VISKNAHGLSFKVKLTPNAAKNALVRIDKDAEGNTHLKASVTTVPEKGKANAALLKLLAKKLDLPKSTIRLISGDTSRLKTIQLSGNADELTHLLNAKLRALGLMG
jgi:uncharacterized protein (TIGR00251 family)